jgi:hypothetical protein
MENMQKAVMAYLRCCTSIYLMGDRKTIKTSAGNVSYLTSEQVAFQMQVTYITT